MSKQSNQRYRKEKERKMNESSQTSGGSNTYKDETSNNKLASNKTENSR